MHVNRKTEIPISQQKIFLGELCSFEENYALLFKKHDNSFSPTANKVTPAFLRQVQVTCKSNLLIINHYSSLGMEVNLHTSKFYLSDNTV